MYLVLTRLNPKILAQLLQGRAGAAIASDWRVLTISNTLTEAKQVAESQPSGHVWAIVSVSGAVFGETPI